MNFSLRRMQLKIYQDTNITDHIRPQKIYMTGSFIVLTVLHLYKSHHSLQLHPRFLFLHLPFRLPYYENKSKTNDSNGNTYVFCTTRKTDIPTSEFFVKKVFFFLLICLHLHSHQFMLKSTYPLLEKLC